MMLKHRCSKCGTVMSQKADAMQCSACDGHWLIINSIPVYDSANTLGLFRWLNSNSALRSVLVSALKDGTSTMAGTEVNTRHRDQSVLKQLEVAGLVSDADSTTGTRPVKLTNLGRSIADCLVQYEATHELSEMFQRMPLRSDSVFCDVGCGAGAALVKACEFFPRLVVGLDRDLKAVLAAKILLGKSSQKVLLVQADMTRLPFKPGILSHLCCRLAILYVDQKRAVAEMGRVLGRGGMSFFSRIHGSSMCSYC